MDALSGLKVIDLSPTRLGAQVTQVLADYGADVVWVEPPGGAGLRTTPGFPFLGRGKRSVVFDLALGADVEQLLDLVHRADVLVETFRPGVADRLGLGYETLWTRNPRLVYASISGWGRSGPYASAPGYEGLVQAKLGVFHEFRNMHDAARPPFVSVPWCTFAASHVALHGILAALFERERSGEGQHVSTSLAQSFAALDTWDWFVQMINERYPDAYPGAETFDERGIPASPIVFMLLAGLTSDGRWLQFAQVAPRLFLAFMKALGLESMFGDPEWKGLPLLEDPDRRLELWTRMLEAVRAKSLAEWEAVFAADPDVFAERLRSGEDVLDHPQLVADAKVVSLGGHRQPGSLFEMSAAPARLDRPAPALDGDAATIDWARTDGPASTDASTVATRRLPLDGVTVLELSTMFAAPYGATLLTDLGARVIKVEPLTGDPIRTMLPFPELAALKVMQGKDSICVDVGTDEGRAIVHALAARSDLVLQSWRSGVAERLGIDAATLHGVNPRLVYLYSPGYGDGPPNGHRAAYAPSIGAAAGLTRTPLGDLVVESAELSMEEIQAAARRIGAAGMRTPAQADGIAAIGVATGLLLGLLARERGAGGQVLSGSMLVTNAHVLADEVVGGGGRAPAPDSELHGLGARYRVYDAADGWVFLAVPAEREWDALVKALAPYADLAGDPRFSTEDARRRNDEVLAGVLADVFRSRRRDEWERDLLAMDVGCVAVSTAPCSAVLQSEAFGYDNGFVVDVDHATFDRHPRNAPLVQFSRSATQAKPGVLAGTSTDELLTELGYNPDRIQEMRDRGVVG